MLLPEKEKRLLKDLIGRKVDGIFVPGLQASLPVEVYLLLGSREVLKIDSCSRSQQPTETMKSYPQLRLQRITSLPNYPLRQILPETGDIVQSIRVVSEQVQSPNEFIIFTCGFSFHFTGKHYVSILRDSCRNPGLHVSLVNAASDELLHDERYIHHILDDL